MVVEDHGRLIGDHSLGREVGLHLHAQADGALADRRRSVGGQEVAVRRRREGVAEPRRSVEVSGQHAGRLIDARVELDRAASRTRLEQAGEGIHAQLARGLRSGDQSIA